MDITSQCVVELTWTLKDTLGDVLDELDEPVAFYVGGQDLLPKIEEALQGHSVGAKVDLHLEPEDAFGDFLVLDEPASELTVVIIGKVSSLASLEDQLQGWEDAMLEEGSLSWLYERFPQTT